MRIITQNGGIQVYMPESMQAELSLEEKLEILWELESKQARHLYQEAIYKVEKCKKKLRDAEGNLEYAKDVLESLNIKPL
jgi:hypothetical protein